MRRPAIPHYASKAISDIGDDDGGVLQAFDPCAIRSEARMRGRRWPYTPTSSPIRQGQDSSPIAKTRPPNAKIARDTLGDHHERRRVEIGPIPPALFDHLVGGKQPWRHVEAERLGGLEVHDHVDLPDQLDR